MRINRFIAGCIDVSRRGADSLIKSGQIKLNGKIVKDFVDIDEKRDIVEINGERLRFRSVKRYFAFYKPPFVLSATKDESGKAVVCDYFRDVKERLICIGRLDYLSEGLLLVTNDGDFANRVMHPKFKIRKTYLIKTKDRISDEEVKRMSNGVQLEDGFFKPLNIKLTKDPFWIVAAIDSGRNRVLRRFFKAFSVPILKLKRIAIGNIDLGNLEIGKYRKIDPRELMQIKN